MLCLGPPWVDAFAQGRVAALWGQPSAGYCVCKMLLCNRSDALRVVTPGHKFPDNYKAENASRDALEAGSLVSPQKK